MCYLDDIGLVRVMRSGFDSRWRYHVFIDLRTSCSHFAHTLSLFFKGFWGSTYGFKTRYINPASKWIVCTSTPRRPPKIGLCAWDQSVGATMSLRESTRARFQPTLAAWRSGFTP